VIFFCEKHIYIPSKGEIERVTIHLQQFWLQLFTKQQKHLQQAMLVPSDKKKRRLSNKYSRNVGDKEKHIAFFSAIF